MGCHYHSAQSILIVFWQDFQTATMIHCSTQSYSRTRRQ
uniref:Uncharacterized protein n=1 Tax=Rhizophora mucronata TaxID=61149 RepID=A0A2P2IJS2_RHIMU